MKCNKFWYDKLSLLFVTDFLVDYPADLLTEWLTDWLTDWLKDRQTKTERVIAWSIDWSSQTLPQAESGSDTSFSSVDHESATRGLHELRQHYLDTIAKIRDDVLDHVHQTKASAAKKIRLAKSNFASWIQKHVMHSWGANKPPLAPLPGGGRKQKRFQIQTRAWIPSRAELFQSLFSLIAKNFSSTVRIITLLNIIIPTTPVT